MLSVVQYPRWPRQLFQHLGERRSNPSHRLLGLADLELAWILYSQSSFSTSPDYKRESSRHRTLIQPLQCIVLRCFKYNDAILKLDDLLVTVVISLDGKLSFVVDMAVEHGGVPFVWFTE